MSNLQVLVFGAATMTFVGFLGSYAYFNRKEKLSFISIILAYLTGIVMGYGVFR